jgi:hypothetical protein
LVEENVGASTKRGVSNKKMMKRRKTLICVLTPFFFIFLNEGILYRGT